MNAIQEFGAALADDAASLALLHERELTADTIAALRAADFPRNLALLPPGAEANAAMDMLADALTALPPAPPPAIMDMLAAEFAAIYLTGAHGASPCESVWLDDDHLACQTPMFELRDIYAAAGLAAANWRQRPDDHLVLQLLYIAHALRNGTTTEDWRRLARMLDEHLLRWLPDFAARVFARSEHAFYAGLVAVTAAWADTLRELLATQLDEPRPTTEEIAARLTKTAITEPLVYMPGTGPGW